MNHEEVILDKFYIVGISVRTTNRDYQSQGDIAKLLEAFFENEYLQQVLPDKLSNDVYCMYTDYESDYMGEYTCIMGYRVSGIKNIPPNQNLAVKEIPQSKYYKYVSEGELPYAVGKTWAHIWQSDIDRKYAADFDIYGDESKDTNNAKVTTYLSVNQ